MYGKRFSHKTMAVDKPEHESDTKSGSPAQNVKVTKGPKGNRHYSKKAVMLAMADHGDRKSSAKVRGGMNHG